MTKKVHEIVYRCLLGGLLFVVTYAFVAVVCIEFLSASNVRFWNVRSLMLQSLGWCLLVQIVIVLGFLAIRKWMMSIVTVGLIMLLFFATVLSALMVGPTIETVQKKVVSTIGVTPSELVCVGGNLRRESTILFRYNGSAPFTNMGELVSIKDQDVGIVLGVLERMNVKVSNDMPIKVLKFPLEFDTIYCVICGKERWIVFFGMSVM